MPVKSALSGGSTIEPVTGRYTISSGIVDQLVALGYVRARGIISYPQSQDREVIAQGILAPTVYNV